MSELTIDRFMTAQPAIAATGVARGSLIETVSGPRPIETLKLGDLIKTRDAGFQPLRSKSRQKMHGKAAAAPVLIAAGVFGNATPLLVAPMHPVLVIDCQGDLDDVLIEARCLINGTTVTCEEVSQVEYHNLGFDDHQIVIAQGVPVASDIPHDGGTFVQAVSPRRCPSVIGGKTLVGAV